MTPFDPDEALFIKANHVQCLNHSEHQSCMYCGHVLTTYDTQSIIINRYGAYHEECSESKKSLTYEDHRKSSLLWLWEPSHWYCLENKFFSNNNLITDNKVTHEKNS
jgi:hypothetical protein